MTLLIKSFQSPFNFNSVKLIANIRIEYDYETEPPDIHFESKEEESDYLWKFQSGEYINLWLCVKASCLGEIGIDTLGQVHILANDADNQIETTISSHQMVKNALKNLEENILSKIKLLEEKLGLKFNK